MIYDIIKLTVSYGDKRGIVHSDMPFPVLKEDLINFAYNVDDIKDFDGVNCVHVIFNSAEEKENPIIRGRLFGASGYTADRGIFFDNY
jgi:hypothetical protein